MSSNGKLPWFQFYPADWVNDTRMLDLQSKGAWFEIINAMWNAPNRGVISGTLEEFSLLLGCYIDVTTVILDRFERQNICDFYRDGNGVVTLKCRRMIREEAEREHNRERVAKFRKKQSCNGDVTSNVTDKKTEVISQKTEKEPPISPKGNESGLFDLVQETNGTRNGKHSEFDDMKRRVGAMFGRGPGGTWTPKEEKSLKLYLKPLLESIDILEPFYADKSDNLFHRKRIDTFLNNVPGEIDSARVYFSNKRIGSNGHSKPGSALSNC